MDKIRVLHQEDIMIYKKILFSFIVSSLLCMNTSSFGNNSSLLLQNNTSPNNQKLHATSEHKTEVRVNNDTSFPFYYHVTGSFSFDRLIPPGEYLSILSDERVYDTVPIILLDKDKKEIFNNLVPNHTEINTSDLIGKSK